MVATKRTPKAPLDMTARRKAKQQPVTVPIPQPEAEPEAEAEQQPDMVIVRLVLRYMVDGQKALEAAYPIQFPRPGEDQIASLCLELDARLLLQALEPKLGPTPASRLQVWVPGQQ